MDSTLTLFFYISIFLVSLFSLYISEKSKDLRTKQIFKFFSFFLLWFICVFRASSVGTDYIKVGNAYSRLVLNDYNYNYNWFWLPLRYFCKLIGLVFGSKMFWFYFILGTLTVSLFYKFIYKVCDNKVMSLFLFIVFGIYLQSFNQTRQIVALIFALYSMRYLKDNNFSKYLLTILIGSIFHETLLVFIPLYILKDMKVTHKTLMLYIIGSIILLLMHDLIYDLISHTKYVIYFSSQYNVSKLSSTILNLFVRIILYIFCMKNKNDLEGSLYNFSFNMVTICTILQFLVVKYYFFARFTTYFYAFYIILLPKCIDNYLKRFTPNSRRIVRGLIYIVLFAYFIVYYKSSSGAVGSGYDLYNFVFTN